MVTENRFHFVGEQLWLDFVNTEVVAQGERVDLLGSFDDLMAWASAAGILDAAQARDLARKPRDTDKALGAAREFRATLREMARRIADGGRTVPQATLDRLNDALRARDGQMEVVRTKEGYETRFRPLFTDAAQLLAPIAESAARLLSDGDLTLVRKCQNPQCILYFHDTTKNHRRRWCSMTACGNRAKVAAFYQRARS